VGRRRRIEVARLTSGVHDLLLLDEPTNRLSPGLVEELEEALSRYTGALVIVTHDRRTRPAGTWNSERGPWPMTPTGSDVDVALCRQIGSPINRLNT
jgi:ABC-type uncharacterized transport system YnjBCD ATPase subunit